MSYQNNEGFQAPPPPPPFPETAPVTGPSMSTAETLSGIFFEPGRTFESLRARPRFLVAALIIIALTMAFTVLFFGRVGYENIMRAAMENNSRMEQMSAEDRERAIEMQSSPIFKAFAYVSPLIGLAAFFAIGAALYLLGAMATGRTMTYPQALSVWTYSSFPPTVLAMVANIVLLFVKSVDDVDLVQASRRGLVQANLGMLVNPTASPLLATLLGSFDLFSFYGLFLAAIGLRKVAGLSSGAAWAVVIVIWLLGVIMRVAFAAISGGAM